MQAKSERPVLKLRGVGELLAVDYLVQMPRTHADPSAELGLPDTPVLEGLADEATHLHDHRFGGSIHLLVAHSDTPPSPGANSNRTQSKPGITRNPTAPSGIGTRVVQTGSK